MGDLDVKIRMGEISLSREVITDLNTDQIREFRKTLLPEVDRRYKGQYPAKFPGEVKHLTDKEWQAMMQPDRQGNCSLCNTLQDTIDKAADFIIPDANAVVAAGCYVICAASLGTACGQCLVAAGGVAVAAYNAYVSCKNGCCRCKWYKPWCCVCKPACLLAFLAILA